MQATEQQTGDPPAHTETVSKYLIVGQRYMGKKAGDGSKYTCMQHHQ